VALVFAVVAAVLLGVSDFMAARGTRSEPPATITRTVVAVSATTSPVLLLLVDWSWQWRDALLGALSGLTMITGILLLYRGYSVARMGVVAPMSSVVLTAIPVLVDVARGITPGGLGVVGMIVGVIALVLASYSPEGTGSMRSGVVLGVTSGVAFGAAFTLMGEVSTDAGLMPVVIQRGVGLVMLVVLARQLGGPLIAHGRAARRYCVVAGLAAMVAIASLQAAFQRGASGPIAVASSQFASVAVVLSVLFNRERMRWWQGAGVAAAAAGVSLMALS
jgi:drug/metabolite transporter (DMT)-like permease